MQENKLLFWSYRLILAIIFIAPFFFLPFLSIEFGKALIIFTLSTCAIVFSYKKLFSYTSISIPKNPFVLAMIVLPCVFMLSALATTASICKTGGETGLPYLCFPTLHVSLAGYGFEVGTVGTITIFSLIFLLTTQLFRSKEKVFYAELLFLSSVGIVVLFQLIHLFIPTFTLGLFFGATANLLGNWNSLALFVGSGIIASLALLELLPLSKLFRTIVVTLLGLSIILVGIINFRIAWVFVAVLTVIIGLYSWHTRKNASKSTDVFEQKKKPLLYSLIVFVISIGAFFSFGFIGEKISPLLNIDHTEVRPNWSSTIEITKEIFKQNLLFGTGPNKFGEAWQSFRSNSINNEPVLWNADFDHGIGLISTFIVTTGLFGLIVLVCLLGSFLWLGIKIFRLKLVDPLSRYVIISSYLLALYFWGVTIFYIPGLVMFLLAFIFSGFAFAIYRANVSGAEWNIAFGTSGKKHFLYVLKITAIMAFVLCVGIYFFLQTIASMYYQKGLRVFNDSGDRISARNYILKAVSLIHNDFYYRSLVDLQLGDISIILSRADNLEKIPADFQNAVLLAEQYATKAVEYNPRNFRNWIGLGLVYEAVVPTGNEQAYQNAIASYREALIANPKNPGPLLRLARLEAGMGSFDKAREYANIALQIKPNFSEVAFLLSQIEVEAKNVDGAIKTIQNAITVSPNDTLLHFQLGLLRYDKKDYRGAVTAFDQAINLIPDYANAKYFRGLSYVRLGDKEKALSDFNSILITNPDNAEVKFIIENVENKRDPFANAEPPIDNQPEKREELPITEQ